MDYAAYPEQQLTPPDRGDYTLEQQHHDLEDYIYHMDWESVFSMLAQSEELEIIMNNLVLMYFAKRYQSKSLTTCINTIVNEFERAAEKSFKRGY